MVSARESTALVIAVAVDALQWLLLPLFAEGGFSPLDAGLDAAAFAVLTGLLGFSPLLLPTVAVELLPMADLAPAWTVAVAVIIWRRRSARRKATEDLVAAASASEADPRGRSSGSLGLQVHQRDQHPH